jgi:hypothetical protein
MTRIVGAFSLVAITLGVLLHADAAEAVGALHTWVSGVGADANPCTRASPCATFAGAYANTAPGGEIDVLGGGEFGRLTIDHAITIANDGTGTAAITPLTNGSAIFINAGASDAIVLRGLNLDGAKSGVIPGVIVQGGSLLIDHCIIHDFQTRPGLQFVPAHSATLWVKDTLFFNDGATNFTSVELIAPVTGAVTARFERVQILHAIGNAIRVDGSTTASPIDVELHDVTVDGSIGGSGIFVDTTGGGAATITADKLTSSHNAAYGLRIVGAAARIFLSRSVITNNGIGIGASGGGAIFSYADNRFAGNSGGDGVTPTPIALK